MALKMMTAGFVSSEVDPQYFDDNMLTDEDFRFDPENFLEVTLEDKNILESFSSQLQSKFEQENQTALKNGRTQPFDFAQNMDLCHNFDDLLKDCLNESEIKLEPPSPYSAEGSSPENDVSVISIPDEDSSYGVNGLISDTPPQTPPGLLERVSHSPPTSSFSPIVVSLSAVPTLTYVVPPKQPNVNPVKLRMNIQPKPNSEKGSATLGLRSSIGQEAFSSDQIVKLPSGVFRVKDPRPTAPLSSVPSTNGPKKNGMSKSNLFEVCTAALKRQERIIKNRESAYLSRKRKKEYVQRIEEELNQITEENNNLRDENFRLRQKVVDLEKEVLSLRATFTSKGLKKTICVMVALCMLTFNFASFGSVFDKVSPKHQVKTGRENHRIGRSLLWSEGNGTMERNATKSILHDTFMKEEEDSAYIVAWDNSYNSSTCQQFINKSESLRLEKDLLGWVKRVEKKQKQKESKLKNRSVNMETVLPPLPKLQQLGLRHRNDNNKDIWAKRKNRNEILIYQTPRKDYEDFFDAIHRRDDSFYFVSFSGDHLLLPAIAHNQTLRPRMSFVMPAMILNDAVNDSDDHISMMQIDCEVLDTKLVYIKESVIPEHLRQKPSNSSKSSGKNESRYALNRNSKQILEAARLKLPSGHG